MAALVAQPVMLEAVAVLVAIQVLAVEAVILVLLLL
jgi:hypothetical protein